MIKMKKQLLIMMMVCVLMIPGGVAQAKKMKHYMTLPYNLEQASGKPPQVKAFVNGKKVTGKNKFTAQITGDETVDFEQKDIRIFAKSGEPIRYIICLDNSMSVDEMQFEMAKEQLAALRKSMNKKDKMQFFTVGSDNAKGTKKKIFYAAGKKNVKKDVKAIKSIKRTKNKTVLYRSLCQILRSAENQDMRTIVILVTDGEDDSGGTDKENYNVNPAVKKSKIPIYGILLKNISQVPNTKKINNTKANILNPTVGRGYFDICNTPDDVARTFKQIQQVLFNETFVIFFQDKNNSNKTLQKASLLVSCDEVMNGELKSEQFIYSTTDTVDKTPPEISKIKKKGKNTIRLTIKDDQTENILGAEEPKNYTVKDKKGVVWKVSKVTNVGNGQYELAFEKELYSGKYTLKCSNITDDSEEQNAITKKYSFSFKGKKRNIVLEFLKSFWWILLIAVVAAIGVVIIIILKRRSVEVKEVDAGELFQSDRKMIRLTITDQYGNVQDMDYAVDGSLFVGRSDINQIFYDDEKLSRQHFVIEATKMACYIDDLQTTNGTFVNGAKVTGRRQLSDGDVITAGNEKFVFYVIPDVGGELF